MGLKEELLENPEFKKIYNEKGLYDYNSSERIDNNFIKEFLYLYEKVSFLEKKYIDNPQQRKEIHKELRVKLIQLYFISKEIHNHINVLLDKCNNSPLENNHIVEINNVSLFLKLIQKLANDKNNIYDLKNIKITDFRWVTKEEVEPLFNSITILSTKSAINNLSENKNYYAKDVYEYLEKLSKKDIPLIYTTTPMTKNSLKTNKEKFYVSSDKNIDIICDIKSDEILNIVIEQLVSYMTTYGSDFTNIDNLAELEKNISNEHPVKKRTLNDEKYIEFHK